MLTLNLLRLSLVIIAGFSAISSVAGLGEVFRGSYYPIIVLSCGLELAKFSATSHAYQNWQDISIKFQTGLVIFVTVTSIFTSVGIFGYLGDSFTKTHITAKKDDIIIHQLQVTQERLNLRILEIDKQIRELPSEFVVGRVKLMNAFADERKQVSKLLDETSDKLQSALKQNVDTVSDLGPVVHLAKAFGTTVETAVGNMILVLALFLDPAALFLTVLLSRKVAENTSEKVDTIPEPVIPRKVGRPVGSRNRDKGVVQDADQTTSTKTDWNFK
jgi:hypothetical protein